MKIYTWNSELQMQWLLSSSKIYEKLKTSIVNHNLVLGMGHCQRQTTQKQLSPFLKQCYQEGYYMATIHKAPFCSDGDLTSHEFFPAPRFFKFPPPNTSSRPGPQSSLLLSLHLSPWFCITKAQKNWFGTIKPCLKCGERKENEGFRGERGGGLG